MHVAVCVWRGGECVCVCVRGVNRGKEVIRYKLI